MDLHAAYCGPARGFLVCYCECTACRDGRGRCTCAGCGAWHRPTTKEETVFDVEIGDGSMTAGEHAASMLRAASPDLMATLPPEPPVPDRDSADSWDMASMDALIEAQDRRAAYGCARLAALFQQQGREHREVVQALAGAEHRAPAADRPFHAARLDAYAAAYGLSGWYRGTDFRGKPFVQVNKLRTAADGNAGRYFTHHADAYQHAADGAYWVVDRDTGRTAHRAHSPKEATAWIKDNGGGA